MKDPLRLKIDAGASEKLAQGGSLARLPRVRFAHHARCVGSARQEKNSSKQNQAKVLVDFDSSPDSGVADDLLPSPVCVSRLGGEPGISPADIVDEGDTAR